MEFPGLSFEPGKNLEKEIWQSLGVHVTHSVLDRASFFLVAAFGRCKFRLSSETVGSLLQAAIGGTAKQFYVTQLGDRTFKFVVSTKSVGLFVANLRSFSCDSFKVLFFLWGNGGPNWRTKFHRYLLEEESSWSSSSSKNSRRSFVEVVKSSVLLGANAVPLGLAQMANPAMLSSANAMPLGLNHHFSLVGTRKSTFDRIVFPRMANHPPLLSSPDGLQTWRCSRCLSPSHWRANCKHPIQCRACFLLGHIAARYSQFKIDGGLTYLGRANRRAATAQTEWTGLVPNAQPLTSGPSTHNY